MRTEDDDRHFAIEGKVEPNRFVKRSWKRIIDMRRESVKHISFLAFITCSII
jgi:hypothetical protein